MFDVRQAARGAFAPSRPPVCLLAESITAQPDRAAVRPHGGAPISRAGYNTAIVHGYLNGTYYLVTYNRRRRHPLRARSVPSAGGPRRATGCFGTSTLERRASAAE
jgi:hypothetical protein